MTSRLKPYIQSTSLPIVEVLPELLNSMQAHSRLILHAPPGAGKSTLVPLALLEADWLQGRKIIMLEPRRLAAKAIAQRMAELLGEAPGQTVGYRIRFETKVTEQTQIEVVTEGILTRILQSDNALEDYAAVLFDEFHERSIFADVSLALSLESQSILRPDLRLLIMSATLDIPDLQAKFDAPLVQSLGRQYPVEVVYRDRHDVRMIPEMVAQSVKELCEEREGDILAFLPGEGEIMRCAEILKRMKTPALILTLYGQLPWHKQQLALRPHPEGRRKVVLATAIAETSLTIEGVRNVVDCGFERSAVFDPRSGLPRLQTTEITLDAAQQRAGRAGRLAPGYAVRLWPKAKQHQLVEHRPPEIESADLCAMVLDLAAWGTSDPADLKWLSPPPQGAVLQAKETLLALGAIDEEGRITAQGRAIHRLPCHPRIAHMLLGAEAHGVQALACDVAALIEERDPLGKEAGIDINRRIEVLRRQRAEHRLGKTMARIERVAASYRHLLKVEADNAFFDPFETGFLIVLAFPERIACARPGNNAQFQLSNGAYAMAGHKDDLAHESWLAVAHMNLRERQGRIFLAAPLNPQDLAPMVQERDHISWEAKKGELLAERQWRLGAIVLKRAPLAQVDEDTKIAVLCRVLKKDGAHLLNFDEQVKQWQNRVMALRQWNDDERFPDVSTPKLLDSVEQWLSPYLPKVRNANDLKKLPLHDILKSSLDWELQQTLDQLAPERIQVPSGSAIRLIYQDNGENPVLAVRLQELFGWAETPRINKGRTALVLHLLSPGFKPWQVTSDLRSFWNEAYHEIKKEGKRRYPKHAWPDDPWQAEAVRGVRPKR